MKLVRHIPNLLTLTNLFLGIVAILALTRDQVVVALLCMGGSLIADILDGALARKLGVDNQLGVQLDSLADVVTFGALPAMMIYYCGTTYGNGDLTIWTINLFAALAGVSAGLRLGRFNVDTRPRNYFWGLATPGGGIMIAGWLWAEYAGKMGSLGVFHQSWLLIAVPLFLAIAYQIPLPLPGLKSPVAGKVTAAVIFAMTLLGFILHGPLAISAGILAYVISGVVNLVIKFY
jgi:CDP-diacylglycerol--serine O-phosphatidyltransferase